MSVTIQDNFNTAAAKPIDNRYGPYNSNAAAASAIPEIYRYKGLTVGVLTSGVVEEYWWDNVLTGNPIKKSAVGNLTGVTQGTGIIVDNTNPQIPQVSVNTAYVQTVGNISLDVSTDGTSDTLYPSVKAVKTYADGLITGLLNDRGNYTPSTVSPGPYPSTGGSGTAGAILKGDIWFISVVGTGYLGTTPVVTGSSVRALVDSPGVSTPADWDILDVGLGFTPENVTNKVSTGANVNADPTSTSKYPSVNALVEYVTNHSPTPTTPNLQAVTNAGSITTNPISAQAFGFYDSSTSSYAGLSCDATGSPSRILIEDSYANPRLSLDTAGTDLTIWANTGSTQGVLDFASVTGTKTYTFPNSTGTIVLDGDLSAYLTTAAAATTYLTQSNAASTYLTQANAITTYVPYSGASGNVDLGTYVLNFTGPFTDTLSIDSDEIHFQQSSNYDTTINGLGINFSYNTANLNLNSDAGNSPFVTATSSIGNVVQIKASGLGANTSGYALFGYSPTGCYTTLGANLSVIPSTVSTLSLPLTSGTLLTTVATPVADLTTGTDGRVTIPYATGSVVGLVSISSQTFSGTKIFNDGLQVYGQKLYSNITVETPNISGLLGTGTDFNAPHFNIYSGRGTGNGIGGDVYINTYNGGGTSGTTPQTATTKVTIKGTTGNVGIGTTSPTDKLHIKDSYPSLKIEATSGLTVTGSLSTDPFGMAYGSFVVGSSGHLKLASYTGTQYIIDGFGNHWFGSGFSSFPSTNNKYWFKAGSMFVEDRISSLTLGVGFNGPVNASAAFEIQSTTKGFLLPRIGTGSFPSSPVKGLMVYADADIDTGRLEGVYVRDSTNTWRRLSWT